MQANQNFIYTITLMLSHYAVAHGITKYIIYTFLFEKIRKPQILSFVQM